MRVSNDPGSLTELSRTNLWGIIFDTFPWYTDDYTDLFINNKFLGASGTWSDLHEKLHWILDDMV